MKLMLGSTYNIVIFELSMLNEVYARMQVNYSHLNYPLMISSYDLMYRVNITTCVEFI
jgi:hypothetical protein